MGIKFIKMKVFLAIFFTTCFLNLHAQDQLKGKVINVKGEPIRGASVSFGNNRGVLTDSLGQFILPLYTDKQIRISITSSGFQQVDTTIEKNNEAIVIVMKNEATQLEDVIIIASSRTNSTIEDLPTKVEVLGTEEVFEENQIKPGNIASLLGDIAGIQIQQTNAATGNADMRIQGLPGKYTQILRDGMPLFGGYSGSFSILQIPPLDLQQIELVKGASSTLYGGGAIAGMVNLVSKKPRLGKDEHIITMNRSSLKENNFNAFFSSRNKKIGYTLYVGATKQDEVDVNKDKYSDVPRVGSLFFHPRLFFYLTPQSKLILGYTVNTENRIGGSMVGIKAKSADNFFIQNKSLRNTVDFAYDHEYSNGTTLTAKGSLSFFNRDVNTNLNYLKGQQKLWYTELAYNGRKNGHTWVTGLNFNGDHYQTNASSGSILPQQNGQTIGVFVQDDWKIGKKFTMQGGVRTDHHFTYGNFFLPRISMMYKATHEITLRMGGGLGYKTPTLFNAELDEREYSSWLGFVSDIKPERSNGFNMDFNYKTSVGEWELTFNQAFFYNQINRTFLMKVYPSLLPPSPYFYYNASAPLKTNGFETYVQAMHNALELYLGYLYTDARKTYDEVQPHLPLIARNKLAGIIAYEFSDKMRAGIESAFTGKQYLSNGNTTKGYLFAAAMIRYGIGKVSFVLNCENLLDYRQNKHTQVVFPPYNNPSFPEIWAPLDGRVVNLSMMIKW
jgi:outer membrane receptor for ferrienterochelin and colicins